MPGLMQPTLFDLFDAPAFPRSAAVADAIESLASNSGKEVRGAIFTRVEVVDFILDVVGYVDSEFLHTQRILEPSFGGGDFLLPIVDRLLASWRKHGGSTSSVLDELGDAIRAVELHRETFESTRKAVVNRLKTKGLSIPIASELAHRWMIQGISFLNSRTLVLTMLSAIPLMSGRSSFPPRYCLNIVVITRQCMTVQTFAFLLSNARYHFSMKAGHLVSFVPTAG